LVIGLRKLLLQGVLLLFGACTHERSKL
jgi:hypothetical protein